MSHSGLIVLFKGKKKEKKKKKLDINAPTHV